MFDKKEEKLKDLLNKMVAQDKNLSREIGLARIEEAWKQKMGEMINSYTQRLYFSGGKLTVYLSSSILRNQMNHNRDRIIELINTECGDEVVKEISIR